MELLKTEDLVHSFKLYDEEGNVTGNFTALDHIDITVNKGDFVAILGRNGSGKSTLARHINALMLPSEGAIWVSGMNTRDESKLFEIRKTAGMVFQNPDNQMVSTVIEEDVAFGPENLGIDHPELEERVRDALCKVGMTEYSTMSPNKLSGGQKQRIAIAGVLAMKPQAIILDEATAMLDPKGRAEVLDTMIKLHKEENVTLILITHHMEEAALADRLIVMKHGKVVLDGKPAEVFSREAEVRDCGLRVPEVVRLKEMLADRGIELSGTILTEEDIIEAIGRLEVVH